MTISSFPSFAQSVQDYFLKHLINQKNASSQTVASYRDTMRQSGSWRSFD
jgi:integrase/recombinase XerD